jgi:hypothetical protein
MPSAPRPADQNGFGLPDIDSHIRQRHQADKSFQIVQIGLYRNMDKEIMGNMQSALIGQYDLPFCPVALNNLKNAHIPGGKSSDLKLFEVADLSR